MKSSLKYFGCVIKAVIFVAVLSLSGYIAAPLILSGYVYQSKTPRPSPSLPATGVQPVPEDAAQKEGEELVLQKDQGPPQFIANPDLHVRMAAAYVAAAEDQHDERGVVVKRGHGRFSSEDMPYLWFFSFWDLQKDELQDHTLLLLVWMHHMTFSQYQVELHEVPFSGGALFWTDIREWGWNQDARQAVGERDLYCAEPWIDHHTAEYLRQRLGTQLSEGAFKGREIALFQGKTRRELILPSVAVVTATQFLRDTMETARSPSYYDLLFSQFRFKGGSRDVVKEVDDVVKVKKIIDHPGGDLKYPDGTVARSVKAGRYFYFQEVVQKKSIIVKGQEAKFVDFPKNLAEYESAFGIDVMRKFQLDTGIDSDFGAVVRGGLADKKNGSRVSLHDRLVVTQQGRFGLHMESFDTNNPVGEQNYGEALFFGGQKYVKGKGAFAKAAAGEMITYTPVGAFACFLVNRADGNKRVEFGTNDIVAHRDTTTMDMRVLNAHACARCHSAEGGYILPRSIHTEQSLKNVVNSKVKDPEQLQRILGFFKEQQALVEGAQRRYFALISSLTKGKWTGKDFSAAIGNFVADYDDALTLEEAAASVGIPVEELMPLLVASPLNSLNALSTGTPIPRRVWEADGYPNVQLLRQAKVNQAKHLH